MASGANNDMAMLQGSRFVSAVETDQGRRIAEAIVKQATGGDRITARFLYSEFFEFQPTFKIFLATNHRPTIRGTDHAMWRRVRLIPFEVQIPEQEQDRHLAQKIKDAELPGVLNWLLKGCLAWQAEGLQPPPRVMAATSNYREEQDVLGRFLGEVCEEQPAAMTLGKDLYAAYEQWCKDVGERPATMREFNAALDERGTFTRDKGKQGVRWYGIAVNPAYLPLGRVIAASGDQR
jgi:putative DNA primase/helicase